MKPEQIAQIVEWREAGLSYTEIARRSGYCLKHVCHVHARELKRIEKERARSHQAETVPVLDRKLSLLDFSARLENCLRNSNIVTVRDVLAYTKGDLLRIPNFGRVCAAELKEKLAELGVTWPATGRTHKF